MSVQVVAWALDNLFAPLLVGAILLSLEHLILNKKNFVRHVKKVGCFLT